MLKKKWLALITTTLLTAQCTLGGIQGLSASASNDPLVTGDLSEIQAIALNEDNAPELAEDNGSNIVGGFSFWGSSSSSSTTAADKTNYTEDAYASYHGYNSLTTNEKKVYDNLKKLSHNLYSGSSSATSLTVSGSTVYSIGKVDLSTYSIDLDSVQKVVSLFRSDNPIYFFVDIALYYSINSSTGYITQLYCGCDSDYTTKSALTSEATKLTNTITSITDNWSDETDYTYAQEAHDWICNQIDYAYYEGTKNPVQELYAHSIIGVFDSSYDGAVCEGYAKAFQLLMNAADVENYYIVGTANGGGHAWNMVQSDDNHCYYVDTTWDDCLNDTTYFEVGETFFSQEHTPQNSDGTGWEYLYDLPEVPDNAYTENYISYTDGDYTYRLYDDHAVLTAYTGSDKHVAVPDEANGLPITEISGAFVNNTNMEYIDIPEGIQSFTYGDNSYGAFYNCLSLKELNLPSTLTTIDYNTFVGCTALECVILPEQTTHIGANAFLNCSSLQKIYVLNPDCEITSSTSLYDSTVLYGLESSTAQTYATNYGRNFEVIDASALTTTTEATTTTETTTTTEETTTTTKATTTTTEETTTPETTTIEETTTTSEETTTTSETTTTPEEITTPETTTTTTEETTITSFTEPTTTIAETTTTETTTTEAVTTSTTTTTETVTTEATLPTLPADEAVADVNKDDQCTITDLVLMNRYLIGSVTLEENQVAAMDCYQDGKIDSTDALTYAGFLIRTIKSLPVIP